VRLANKTAFITGGNSGIGLATAKLFVAEGARVAITGRNKETLQAAARELGPNAIAIEADATDIAATEAAIKQAIKKVPAILKNAKVVVAALPQKHGTIYRGRLSGLEANDARKACHLLTHCMTVAPGAS